MKSVITLFVALSLLMLPVMVHADDPVDLRDKKGIVDPSDLKKFDPKERSLEIKEPPPPPPPPDVPPFEVDRGGIDDTYRPIEAE